MSGIQIESLQLRETWTLAKEPQRRIGIRHHSANNCQLVRTKGALDRSI
jgi:hypothetical protein